MVRARRVEARPHTTLHDQPRGSSRTNDNQCVIVSVPRLLPRSLQTVKHVPFFPSPSCVKKTVKTQTQDSLSANLNAVNHVHFVQGLSQKKDVSPVIVNHCKEKLKYVKNVCCVNQLSFVKPVTNVQHPAPNLPVGARLQNFWQTWLDLGAGPKKS